MSAYYQGFCSALRRSRQRKGWRQAAESARERGMPKTAAFYENLLKEDNR
jgi:DNA invertase Pin-like site-specific DNA recombinase